MQTLAIVASAECRKAMEKYADELRKTGIEVTLRDLSDNDFEMAEGQQEGIVAIEWSDGKENSIQSSDEWEDEFEDEQGEGETAASGMGLQISPYIKTLRAIGRDPVTAQALLERL